MHKGTNIGLNVYNRRIHRRSFEIRNTCLGHNLLLHCQEFTELPRMAINQLLPNLIAASEEVIFSASLIIWTAARAASPATDARDSNVASRASRSRLCVNFIRDS